MLHLFFVTTVVSKTCDSPAACSKFISSSPEADSRSRYQVLDSGLIHCQDESGCISFTAFVSHHLNFLRVATPNYNFRCAHISVHHKQGLDRGQLSTRQSLWQFQQETIIKLWHFIKPATASFLLHTHPHGLIPQPTKLFGYSTRFL